MLDLPNKRSEKILSILLESNESLTAKKLANELDVSSRTIRSDLKKLERWLNKRNINLIRKRGVGVWIEIDHINKIELNKELSNNDKNIFTFSSKERQKHILKSLLLTNDGKTTMKALAEEMYVSKTTIYNDLDHVEKWLEEQNLKLIRKRYYGLEIHGEEKDWRRAFANLLVEYSDSNDDKKIEKIVEASEKFKSNSRIDKKTYNQLNKLFPDTSFNKIEKILQETEKKLEFIFTDETFTGLVIHIAISIARLSKGQDIEMDSSQFKNLKDKPEFEIAAFIANNIEKKLNINIPEAEIGYISLHIMGAKHQQHLESKDMENILNDTRSEIINIAQDIIKMTEYVLNINLSNDKQLLLGLVLHLRPSINRLKYGMSLRNPLLNQIKENYPKVFRAAWISTIIFENRLNLNIPEEEIGYIALHLGAALERLSNEIKVLVICGSGIGTSQLIATRLQSKLSNIKVENIMSIRELMSSETINADLIISSVPLNKNVEKNITIPKVYISALVTDEDVELIKYKINNISKNLQTKRLDLDSTFDKISELFDNELIFLNLDMSNRNEVIEYLSKQMQQKKIVSEDFTRTVLNREELTSTAIEYGVAIPHGEKEYVIKSKVLLATLKRPIKWGDKEVDTIFMLALKSKEIAGVFFKHFQFIMQNKELLNKVKNAKEKNEIKKIFLN